MKHITLIACIILLFAVEVLLSQEVPQTINYQGRLLNAIGAPVPDGTYEITFSLYNLDQTKLWDETLIVEVGSGLFSVTLGQINPLGEIIISNPPPLFLGIKIGENPEMEPRTPLSSGPYALRSLITNEAAIAHSVDQNTIHDGHIIDGTISLADLGPHGAIEGQIIKMGPEGWMIADDNLGTDASGWIDDGTVVHLIDSDDSVGINQTDPQCHLDVNGQAKFGRLTSYVDSLSTITGGSGHMADSISVIGGGEGNTAIGMWSTIAGGAYNFTAGNSASIGGGNGNQADGFGAVISGGTFNMSDGYFTTIGGGYGNVAIGAYSVIAGGGSETAEQGDTANYAGGDYSSIGGGRDNTAIGQYSTVAGGQENLVDADRGTIGGGFHNSVNDVEATVSGGQYNTAGGAQSTVGGGEYNLASGWRGVISGGYADTASAMYTTIGGGRNNVATVAHATVGGGAENRATNNSTTIAGGFQNTASGYNSTVCGGVLNSANGYSATIPGGSQNEASGDYSFAAGRKAQAIHPGCFIWADNMDVIFSTNYENEMAIRAANGMRVHANNPEFGVGIENLGNGDGVRIWANSSQGDTYGAIFAHNTGTGPGIYAFSGLGYAGYFDGDINVTGTVDKAASKYKIDHPLNPENRYLSHSTVSSPDMMNIYNGNVLLDKNGEATVVLPDYFEVLNKDFRYQLTAIGMPAPNLYIAEEIIGNSFRIAGGEPGMKVSWQVTGIRSDAYANAHRTEVIADKSSVERGYYLHPESHGLSPEMGIIKPSDDEKKRLQNSGKK
jgi:hypothetical protein